MNWLKRLFGHGTPYFGGQPVASITGCHVRADRDGVHIVRMTDAEMAAMNAKLPQGSERNVIEGVPYRHPGCVIVAAKDAKGTLR